jgi:hypothetical protein
MTTFSKVNWIAIIIAFAVLLIPGIFLYFVLGNTFWMIFFMIAGCFLIIPYYGLTGLAQAGAPVSLNQTLSDLLKLLKQDKSDKDGKK